MLRADCICAGADFVKRSLYPNVDFFSGIVLRILGMLVTISPIRGCTVCIYSKHSVDTLLNITLFMLLHMLTGNVCVAGIPLSMFTCMFAVARSVGWVAQVDIATLTPHPLSLRLALSSLLVYLC